MTHPLSPITDGCRQARRLVTAMSWYQKCSLSCCLCLPAQQHTGDCTAAQCPQRLMPAQAPLRLSQAGRAQARACASACDRHLSFLATRLQVMLHKRSDGGSAWQRAYMQLVLELLLHQATLVLRLDVCCDISGHVR